MLGTMSSQLALSFPGATGLAGVRSTDYNRQKQPCDCKGVILMTNRIGVTIATLLAAGAVCFTGLASAAPSPAREITSVQCPKACLDIYQPVTCTMSDGSVLEFGNRCYADVYACEHGLKIISCEPKLD